MIATIRTDCPAGTRITALTPSGDTLTSPWTQVIEMASKQVDKISGSARNITRKSTMHMKTATTAIRRATATKNSTRNNTARGLFAATKTLLTGDSSVAYL